MNSWLFQFQIVERGLTYKWSFRKWSHCIMFTWWRIVISVDWPVSRAEAKE